MESSISECKSIEEMFTMSLVFSTVSASYFFFLTPFSLKIGRNELKQ